MSIDNWSRERGVSGQRIGGVSVRSAGENSKKIANGNVSMRTRMGR